MASAPTADICVTDKVKLEDGRVGHVKFIGQIEGKQGVFYGIELAKGAGKNNGNVGNRTYFKCKKNMGVFVKGAKIAQSKPANDSYPRVTYGYKLQIPGKGEGTVRYIGWPEFKPDTLMFGIDLLNNHSGKNDGTIQGKFYFSTTENKGIFLPHTKIETCKVASQTRESIVPDEIPLPSGGATEPDMDPISENAPTEPATDADDNAATDAADDGKESDELKVGDPVLIDKDKKGILRFVGENADTRKTLGAGTWYGVRLTEKRGDCDGSYKGVRLFKCPDGHGLVIQATRVKRKLTADEHDFGDFPEDSEKTADEIEREKALELMRERKKQTKMFRKKFMEIDTDGNKTVELDEFQKLMADTNGTSAEDAEKLFYEIDVSKSGAISFAEFDSWFQKQNAGEYTDGVGDDDMDENTAKQSGAVAAAITSDVGKAVESEKQKEDAAAAAAADDADAGDAPADDAAAGDDAGNADDKPADDDAPAGDDA